MPLTEVGTEKVPGRISEVHIGYDSSNGVKITKGILSFEYDRVRDAIRNEFPGAATSSTINLQKPGHFTFRLKFISDCRIAFFATDVQVAAGNQYALVDNGFSNKIEYFKVLVPIENSSGTPQTRTYTITNGYILRNHGGAGNDKDSEFEYEGEAEYISYSDA